MLFLTGHLGPVRTLAYAPGDASTLASASADATVRLWNPLTRQNWATFRTEWDLTYPLVFSPDGGRLPTAARQGNLCIWDVAMEWPLVTLPLQGEAFVECVACLPDGERLVAAGMTLTRGWGRDWGVLELFRLGEPKSIRHRRFGNNIRCLALSADGQTLVVAGLNRGTVTLLSPEDFQQRRPDLGFFRGAAGCLALSSVGKECMAVGNGGVVELWDVSAGKRQALLKGHWGAVRALTYSPDGRLLLSGGKDGTVRLWDLDAGKERAAYNWDLGPVHAVAFAPDGMTAAAAGETGAILVWDVEMS